MTDIEQEQRRDRQTGLLGAAYFILFLGLFTGFLSFLSLHQHDLIVTFSTPIIFLIWIGAIFAALKTMK